VLLWTVSSIAGLTTRASAIAMPTIVTAAATVSVLRKQRLNTLIGPTSIR
jgi:hypothetical protein